MGDPALEKQYAYQTWQYIDSRVSDRKMSLE